MVIKDGPPPRTRSGVVACDLEIFGLSQRQLHRPRGELALGGFSLDGNTVYLVQNQTDLEKAVKRLSGCKWVFHNANFDLRHLRHWVCFDQLPMSRFHDTQVVEKLLWSGYYNSFALADVARRYLGRLRDKEVRKEFYEKQRITEQMKVYAAEDVCDTWNIYKAQESFLQTYPKALKVWEEIDGPALWAILDFKGFTVDTKRWKTLAEENLDAANDLQKQLGFNPGSPKQTKYAFAKNGITIPSTGDEILSKINGPLARDVLAYRGFAKRASAYGDKFLEFVESDGRVYPSFNVYGAETGRMSSDGPNMQQIPSDREYRSCFVAAKGNKLVIADYSAQEMWISAEFSRDEKMLEALRSGGVYEYVAREMYHDPSITDKSHPLRKKAKAVALGRLYGLTPFGLQAQRDIPLAEGEHLFQQFDRKFIGTTNWIHETHARAKNTEYVETLGGRRFYLNLHFRQWPNNAINAPIQGSGADMMKIAFAHLAKQESCVVAIVHDEMVCEFSTRQSKVGAKQVREAMNWAFQKLCPHTGAEDVVDVHIGASWADKE